MKWRLVAALIATTLLVILVQDIPLSYYIQGVQRDRIITGLERDAFVLAGLRADDNIQSARQRASYRLKRFASHDDGFIERITLKPGQITG